MYTPTLSVLTQLPLQLVVIEWDGIPLKTSTLRRSLEVRPGPEKYGGETSQ